MNHNCSNECVKDEVKAKYDTESFVVLKHHSGILKYAESPFAVPLELGWQKDDYSYVTPCGKKKHTMTQIRKYLIITGSSLSIEQFTLCPTINCSPIKSILAKQSNLICEDVARGMENLPIQVVNDVDDETIDPNLKYVTRYVAGDHIKMNFGVYSCCSCTNNCIDSTCECRRLTMEAAMDEPVPFDQKDGYDLDKLLKRPYPHGLYECNDECSCSKTACYNRVSQEGIKAQLQVFKDPLKGWAVRCLHDLPFGAFICTYSGEVMDHFDSEKFGLELGDEYIFQLSLIETVENKEGYEEDVSDNMLDHSLIEGEDDAVSLNIEDAESTSSHPNCKKVKRDEEDAESVEFGNRNHFVRARKYFAGKVQPGASCDESNGQDFEEKSQVKIQNGQSQDEHEGKKEDEDGDEDDDSLKETYVVDAKRYGNVGRFLNHSCDANCHIQAVFTDTHDQRFHSLAIFTLKEVKAMTELTVDYFYIDKGSFPKCFCGSSQCKFAESSLKSSPSCEERNESASN